MKVYITRHGQVAVGPFLGSVDFPAGDPPLTALGREQAALLGAHLKALGFAGDIYASPFLRTMETAELVAEHTGSRIYPCPAFREIFKTREAAEEFEGSDLATLRRRFPHIAEDAALAFPWWEVKEDSYEDVVARVAGGLPQLPKDRELLLVGHGASASALVDLYKIPMKWRETRDFYNCNLSCIDPEDDSVPTLFANMAHIPYEKATNNPARREALDAARFAAVEPVPIPPGFRPNGRYLLHIGDTFSGKYAYFRALMQLVRPEILVHTGDMVDEVKVGRIPGTRYEYLYKLRFLLQDMAACGAEKIYVTAGNNDLPEEICRLCPTLTLLPENTVIQAGSFTFRIGHDGARFPADTDFTLYGHSERHETWSPEKNRPGAPCRCNALWGSFAIDLDTGALSYFPNPEI